MTGTLAMVGDEALCLITGERLSRFFECAERGRNAVTLEEGDFRREREIQSYSEAVRELMRLSEVLGGPAFNGRGGTVPADIACMMVFKAVAGCASDGDLPPVHQRALLTIEWNKERRVVSSQIMVGIVESWVREERHKTDIIPRALTAFCKNMERRARRLAALDRHNDFLLT